VGPSADELLAHIADALRTSIGPAVAEPFAKTQAFMAAVILEKLAAELRSTADAATAAADNARSVIETLAADDIPAAAANVRCALDELRADASDARWSELVHALYRDRSMLGEEGFGRALAHVRIALRARLDRMLVYAA
jgi:hypothetical protein